MKVKISILYSWLVKLLTAFLPNLPILMRFRGFLYSLLMARCGSNLQVASTATLVSLTGLKFGDDVYVGHNTVILCLDLEVEDEVLVGPNCVIVSGDHTKLNNSFRFGPYQREKITIRRGSWVSANCTVTKGATLPSGSVLAAGSVLNKSFDIENFLYAGAPAKPIKEI